MKNQNWRFLGSNSSIEGVVSLTEFGQAVDIPPGMERDALKVCCVPEKAFAAIGFTAEELAQYKYPGAHVGASPEFLEKKRQALVALHELRHGKET